MPRMRCACGSDLALLRRGHGRTGGAREASLRREALVHGCRISAPGADTNELAPMTGAQTESLTGSYALDLFRTRFGFAVRHVMATRVRGHFVDFDGRAHVDLTQPRNCWASVRIDASSIETGIALRDSHLRTGDLLAAADHPQIRFQSTDVTRLNSETLRVTGVLTIRGVSKSLSVDFTYSQPETDRHGHVRISLMGSTTLNRRDWGVASNGLLETGGLFVSKNVVLELQVCFVSTDTVRRQQPQT